MADRSVVYRIRGDITDLKAKMVAAGKSVSDFADKTTAADREGAKFRKGLTATGDVAGKIGLVAAAGLGAAVIGAAKFDTAMSAVQAATHETADNMEALREAAIQAGADTAFSASEAASAIENLAKAGVTSGDILAGGLQGALDLAAAGTVDVGFAAEAAATAMTQFGLSGEQVPHIADLLAAGAGKAQGEVSDMAMALKQAGLVANQTGLSLEETTGGLAAFAKAGLLGSDAGTSLKTMLLRLVPQTKEAGDAMELIGFNAFDAQGNFVGLTELAGQLKSGLKDMSAEQRLATLQTIFGQDAIRGANVLYEQGAKGIATWIDNVDDSGYAAETAAIKMDNLQGDLEKLKGSLETALIGTGSGAQGPLRSLVQNLDDAVNGFNDLSDGSKQLAGSMLAVTAITGGGLWFGTRVVRGVADTREALSNLGVSATTSGKALRGLAAAGIGLAALAAGAAAIRAIQAATDESLPGVEALTAGLLNIGNGAIVSEFEGIADSMDRILNPTREQAATDLFQTPFEGVFGEAGSLREAKAEIDALDQAFANIATQGGTEAAMDALRQFAEATGLGKDEQRALLDMLDATAEAMAGNANGADLAGGATEDLTGSIDGTTDAFTANTDAINDNVVAMRERVKAALGQLDAEIAYQAAIDAGAEREQERADLQDRINQTINDGVRERADLQRDLADAETSEERQRIQQQITDSMRDQADAVAELREQLKDYDKTLDLDTAAGRENMTVVKGIAEAFNALSDEQQNAKGAYRGARRELVDQAIAFGATRKEAEKYADDLLEVPPRVVTAIELRKQRAQAALEEFKKEFYGLDKATVTAQIRLRADRMADKVDRMGGNASGFKAGGYTGDFEVSEVAGLVHGREFVHDAQTTAMFRPLFEYIHANRRLPGYQDGGYVAQRNSSVTNNYDAGPVSLSREAIESLARAMQMVRPLYGDVTVQGDGQFERQVRERNRNRSGGGR